MRIVQRERGGEAPDIVSVHSKFMEILVVFFVVFADDLSAYAKVIQDYLQLLNQRFRVEANRRHSVRRDKAVKPQSTNEFLNDLPRGLQDRPGICFSPDLPSHPR